jgi:hypothetical protein
LGIAQLSQHEPDGCEAQESEGLAVEIFPILREPSASSEPSESSLGDPSPWQDDEGSRLIGALDDLDVDLSHDFLEGGAKQRALISAIGVELQQERKHAEHRRHDKFAAIAVLDVGRVHDGVDQQALRVDDNVTLLALDLLASVVPRRIVGPPFSALLTLWESITAAVGLASRPIASRHFM